MKLFDNVKNKIETAVKPKGAEMKVCMLGARGVGKTSVLTSMFHDLNAVNANTNLQLLTAKNLRTNDNSTEELINERYKELHAMFNAAKQSDIVMNAGISGDFEERDYSFQFGCKGKENKINLTIKDFPGEFVKDYPDEVRSFIDESNAVILAIDTPHMMECGGEFCESKNQVKAISDFIIQSFADLQDDKLVLLVPLKCEKYYCENRMNEVCETVEKQYEVLIDFFTNGSAKHHIACAVTPILTVGDVVFKDFIRDADGNVKTIGEDKLPAKAVYSFVSREASYSPKYCEQPLCYLLSFVTKLYQRNKNAGSGGFLKKLSSIFKLFPDDPSLLHEVSKFGQRKIKNKDGYKIISGSAIL